MSGKICEACGSIFHADEAWKRTCFPCWKAQKNGERRAQWDNKDLQEELARLRQKITQQAPGAPPDLLGKMVRLCHPDRHNNSQTANEVTQWLLSQRRGSV